MMLTFLEMQPKEVNAFAKGCKMFYMICQNNFIWYHSYKFTFPALHESKAQDEGFNRNSIDWKSEIKKNFLLLSAYQTIIN
jgi:hypothetical protein